MIHPTDLRLGNLVTTIHGERIEIKYLSKKKVKDGYYVTAGVSAQKCFLPEHLFEVKEIEP